MTYSYRCRPRQVLAAAALLAVTLPSPAQPPTVPADVPLAHSLDSLADQAISGGVPRDGIPAIDEPQFLGAAEADDFLQPGDIVFGVVVDGVARAYPQRVLVWHEIVNDQVAGSNISVTYCPLTGTAVGFERGDTTFGVSGDLVNSNLIMYDRATESRWPQVLGTAVAGPLKGQSLEEIPVLWTTWKRWRAAHPGSRVLSSRTGYARNYFRDPYGQYNPRSGYYAEGAPLFPTLAADARLEPKTVVTGARTASGAVAFVKDRMRDAGLVHLEQGGVTFTAAYHPLLDTVHIYRNPGKQGFRREGSRYVAGDGRWTADALPLEPVNGFDAMWFAWAAFFPETALYE